MNQLTKFGLVLGLVCLIATLVLAVTYEVTKPKIDSELRREEHEALKSILPEADSFTEKTLDGIDYFEAVDEGKVVGYCVRLGGQGYGGYMRLIVGVNLKGIIEGVEVLEHQETPGLGAKINEIRPGEKTPWFLRQFVGKDAKVIALNKNIDAITGATISSKAVTEAVKGGINEFFLKMRR